MPVKIISSDNVTYRGPRAKVYLTKEWPEIEQSVKNGIPDGQVVSVSFSMALNIQQAMSAIRKLCFQNGRKYVVFQRKGTIYISPS